MSNFTLPPLSDGINEVTITRWIKKTGDTVAINEVIAEVETDKITIEIAADRAGKLGKIVADIGAKVCVGDVLAQVDASSVYEKASITEIHLPTAIAIHPTPPAYTGRLSPVVSRMVAEHHLDPNLISGTGENGRITKHDVLAYLEKQESRNKSQDERLENTETLPINPQTIIHSQSAPTIVNRNSEIENLQSPIPNPQPLIPHSPMRRRIAEHMMHSLSQSAQVTTVFEVDLAAVAKHREVNKTSYAKEGVNLTWLAYIANAATQALRQHRMVNSEWRDEGILLKSDINLGIAVALQDGLMVPVIPHADELNLKGLARQIQQVAERARNKQTQPNELQNGTFSISNHGAAGSLFGTPVLNQGQCGILGVGMVEKRVKVIASPHGDGMAIRPCAYLSFTFDHRILDGANADAFMATIKKRLENWDEG